MTFSKPTPQRRGEAIRQVRTELGVSIFEVARRTGINPSHLSRAERGLAGIGDDYLANIARALGKPPTYFIDIPETPCPSAEHVPGVATSPTPATAAAKFPAPSAEAPAAPAPEGSHDNE